MGVYHDTILPRLCDLAMRNRHLMPFRERTIGAAEGRVLEVGIGSGLNLPFYTGKAERVIGLDPSPRLLAMSRQAANGAAVPVELLEASAESIPLEDKSIDTVVTTWTLCSIPDAIRALEEMRRVLKSDGRLLFVEHGRSPDSNVCRWQNRLTPLWKSFSGGCHLNRPISQLIKAAGFHIERMDTGYMRGPKPMTFMYEGRARFGGQ